MSHRAGCLFLPGSSAGRRLQAGRPANRQGHVRRSSEYGTMAKNETISIVKEDVKL